MSTLKAIVVTDMSGFTRITRKYGIIHMTSLIWKTRQTLRSLFKSYGALSIRTEADNNFATFADPSQALLAAAQVQNVIDAQNAIVDDTMQIVMGGVGVGFGQGKETEHLFSGTTFFDTFTLGEDVSEKREVLVTKELKDAVEGSLNLAGASFKQMTSADFHNGEKSFFKVEGSPMKAYEADPRSLMAMTDVDKVADSVGCVDKPTSVKHFVHQMLNRFNVTGEERAVVDRTIEAKYMRDVAVLMYGASWDNVARKQGMDRLQELQTDAKSIVDRIIGDQYGGEVVEDALFIFSCAADAVAAAIALRNAFRGDGVVPFTGFGVHVGKVLYARGTDVHWGDPVNTSSKLGQDYCKHGEVVVSDVAWKEAKKMASEVRGDVAEVILGARAAAIEGISISGVDFMAYSIS